MPEWVGYGLIVLVVGGIFWLLEHFVQHAQGDDRSDRGQGSSGSDSFGNPYPH